MVSFVLACAVFNHQLHQADRERPAEKPSIEIACARETLLSGEPIPLTLTIVNRTRQEIQFTKGSPGFWGCTDIGEVSFSDPKGRIVPLPRQLELLHKWNRFVVGNGHWPIVTLLPGQSWRKTIYLQRHVKPLPAGSYMIAYRVELPYDTQNTKNAYGDYVSTNENMYGHGNISVCVKAGTALQLRPIIKHYADMLGCENESQGIEALCLIDSPLAVPYLVKMLSNCKREEDMIIALLRISNRKNALAALRGCLDTNDPRIVRNARALLKEMARKGDIVH